MTRRERRGGDPEPPLESAGERDRRETTHRHPPALGFSLIELMITVPIVVILASIALPSYRNYILRSHRVDATAALLAIAGAQEKYYIQNNTYAAAVGAGGLNMNAASEHGWYDLSITAGDANGFTAQAVVNPDEAQADDDQCHTFSIDALSRKLAFDSGGAPTDDLCWR
jgi:type IV pilus assembly protein PilE